MPFLRKAFPYLAIALGLASLAWAVSFNSLPTADLSFNNGDEVKTVDPAKATGQPEHRILTALFEGLLQNIPDPAGKQPDGNTPIIQAPAVAERYELSADGRTYTFHIRKGAQWSDGTPLTAEDFVWSWRRLLHPETASEYAYQLNYVVGAEAYNSSQLKPGDRVEVELNDRPFKDSDDRTFPRGTMLRGILLKTIKPPEPQIAKETPEKKKREIMAQWREKWAHLVEIKPEETGKGGTRLVQWDKPGKQAVFSQNPAPPEIESSEEIVKCKYVLVDFESTVAIKSPDSLTLVVKLVNPTPFFKELVAFYPLFPVNRACVEKYGSPGWTKPGRIVSNGPFLLHTRRIRDRIRLAKNPNYWNAEQVRLNTVDAYPVKSETTCLNMYLSGQLDWGYPVPSVVIPDLKGRPDYISAPMFTTYFYRCNVNRPPLNIVLVRRALNLAINKREIVESVTRAGQLPATSFVPPGMPGYPQPQADIDYERDVIKARRLLSEAGFPDGKGFPKIQVLFNTQETHRTIAEVVQSNWKNNLGIDVELRNLEWKVFLSSLTKKDYQVARSAWVADYSDPNTFLDMFVTDGPNNQTGWSNAEYDRLIREAAKEADEQERIAMLRQAEEILLTEQPILPIYSYVSNNLVKPYVKGFSANVRDDHPLHLLWIDKDEKERFLRGEQAKP
ncbi:MAG: peptide ABC transporter substrate-binding protein [Pirellulaceae bacterium]